MTRWRRWGPGVAAFLLPAGLLALLYTFSDAAGMMTGDMLGQYAAFYTYLRRALLEGASTAYSMSASLGAGAAGLWTYYLISPVNLVCIFFAPERMAYAVLTMTVVKTGLCGLGMYAALSRGKYKEATIACAVCYALGSYVLCYMQNLMWLDTVALFPVVIRALFSVAGGTRRDGVRYALLLALALATNFYIGYMVCIACVLAFMAQCVCRRSIRGAGRFVAYSLLSGALAALVLLPAALALSGGKGGEAVKLTLKLRYSWAELFNSFFPGAAGANAYVGMLCLALAAMFFFLRQAKVREKICAAGLIGILLLSFQVDALHTAWHGFQRPIGFPCRNAFILAALVVALAHRFLTWVRWPRVLVCALSVTMAAEVCAVGVNTLTRVYGDAQSAQEYAQTYEKTAQALAMLPGDEGFYRVEKTYATDDLNRALTNGYASVSHFSSTQKQPVKRLLNALGLYYETLFPTADRTAGGVPFFCGYDRGATLALDTLLGVRYVFDDGMQTHVQSLTSIGNTQQVEIYHNGSALPLGVLTAEKILSLSLPQGDPYAAQEAVFTALAGETAHFFTPVLEYTRTLNGVSSWADYLERLEEEAEALFTFIAPQDGAYSAYFVLGGSQDACDIYVNGMYCGDYGLYRTDKIVPLGSFSAGDTVRVALRLASDVVEMKDVRFMVEDVRAVCAVAEKIARPQAIDVRDGHVLFTVDADTSRNVLFTTLPLESGWEARIDGEKVQIQPALDALIAIRVPEGTHTVELRYRVPGLAPGLLISVAASIICFVLTRREKRNVQGR